MLVERCNTNRPHPEGLARSANRLEGCVRRPVRSSLYGRFSASGRSAPFCDHVPTTLFVSADSVPR